MEHAYDRYRMARKLLLNLPLRNHLPWTYKRLNAKSSKLSLPVTGQAAPAHPSRSRRTMIPSQSVGALKLTTNRVQSPASASGGPAATGVRLAALITCHLNDAAVFRSDL